MPKILHCPTRIDMAAEDYHALRMDQKFDAFCATQTRSKFSLQSRSSSHEEQKGHVIEHMECLLAYEENPIPVAFHKMLGAPLSPARCSTTATHTASACRHGRHERLCLQVPVQMASLYGESAARQPCCHGAPSPWAALPLFWAAAGESSPDDALTTPRAGPYTPTCTLTNPH